MSLRVAMLTYSVRPRGGVVHALEVSAALADRGHDVELIAIGEAGRRVLPPAAGPGDHVRARRPLSPFDARSPR